MKLVDGPTEVFAPSCQPAMGFAAPGVVCSGVSDARFVIWSRDYPGEFFELLGLIRTPGTDWGAI